MVFLYALPEAVTSARIIPVLQALKFDSSHARSSLPGCHFSHFGSDTFRGMNPVTLGKETLSRLWLNGVVGGCSPCPGRFAMHNHTTRCANTIDPSLERPDRLFALTTTRAFSYICNPTVAAGPPHSGMYFRVNIISPGSAARAPSVFRSGGMFARPVGFGFGKGPQGQCTFCTAVCDDGTTTVGLNHEPLITSV